MIIGRHNSLDKILVPFYTITKQSATSWATQSCKNSPHSWEVLTNRLVHSRLLHTTTFIIIGQDIYLMALDMSTQIVGCSVFMLGSQRAVSK